MAEADNSSGLNKRTKSGCKKSKTLSLSSKHVLRRRQPPKLEKSVGIIYVNNKTPLKAQLYKCEKLLDKGVSELTINGLGAAVYKAVNLALRLNQVHHGTLQLDVTTSTVSLVDELEAQTDDGDDEINTRQNSAIRIHISRKLFTENYSWPY
ncbi:ribonuclease P protein subunit p20 [Pseudomyrmex gracilis]|uniref:ribonuclease P protein subunit p20 n=1 Tax=Pseudomyrmex gracilis TaxID=219809 RepID=UPI0009955080|nr:ribonuclease P protein subunit p20 [Pseudomyrmex gracilis]